MYGGQSQNEDGRLKGGGSAAADCSEVSLAAAIFHTQLRCLRERFGSEGYERALGRLSPEMERQVRELPSLGWVPYRLVEPVMLAMAAEAGKPVEAFQLELVRLSTAMALRGIWRLLARVTSRKALLQRAGSYWRKTWSHGRLEWTSERDGTLTMRVSELVDPVDYMLRGVAFSIQALFEETGRSNVRVAWRRHRDGAEYRVTWT